MQSSSVGQVCSEVVYKVLWARSAQKKWYAKFFCGPGLLRSGIHSAMGQVCSEEVVYKVIWARSAQKWYTKCYGPGLLRSGIQSAMGQIWSEEVVCKVLWERSGQTTVCTSTRRCKPQIKLSISSSHTILTPGQPVLMFL